jgi:hypothetical protein
MEYDDFSNTTRKETNKRISIMLGSHNHIPFGTTDEDCERLYIAHLKPFLSALNKFPHIPVTLHYSGILLSWLERAHFEFFMLIKDMIAREQVELLGGGFYEPMLPLLPPTDKIGQIELLTTYLRKQFGKRPQGCRLPALAWEQNLVGALNNCGMLYTFMDSAQFSGVGLPGDAPCITEDQGKILTVFPVHDGLRDLFAHQRAAPVLESLVERLSLAPSRAGGRAFCVFLDRVFTPARVSGVDGADAACADAAYEIFFEDVSHFDRMDFTLPSKLYAQCAGKGLKKAYFPPSFNTEIKSPLSRQFLIDYPEANYLYSKMMFTHALANQLHGDRSRKRTAREEIWKAQGYDAFCPSESGGIYRHAVRQAAYRALLEAEKITREKDTFAPSLMVFDFDMDGSDEYLFQGECVNCYVKPLGAGVFELDYLPKTWNYLDTFSLERGETCCKRSAWTDILAPPGIFETTFADRIAEIKMQAVQVGFLEGEPHENAFRFCKNEVFETVEADKQHGKVLFRLPPRAELPYGSIEIWKTYQVKYDTVSVQYALVNRGEGTETFSFIPSIDLSFPGENGDFLRMYKIDAEGSPARETAEAGHVLERARGVKFQDIKNEVIITLEADKLFDAYISSVYTPRPANCAMPEASQPEDFAVNRAVLYQSTTIMPIIQVSLGVEERFETVFTMKLYH